MNKNKILSFVILALLILGLAGACSSSDDSDGGRCKYCGRETNWTYRGGGYICYVCDH